MRKVNLGLVDRALAENALAIYDPDTGMFGNGARAVARASELGLEGWLQRVRDWGQVKALLRRRQPVIAAVRTQAAEHLIVADHPVPEPYDAETSERPSDDAELAGMFKETYSGPKELYA